MAGFMAGFGKSFSAAFGNTQQILAAKERDAFRVAYDQFTANKTKYDSENKAWNNAVKAGETIVASLGPNVPPEASLKAAEFLMAGYSPKDVEEKMRNSTFTVKPEELVVPESPEAPSLDSQMQQSGMASPADSLMQPQQQQGPLMAGIQSMFPNAGKSTEQQAMESVQSAAGIDQTEFDKINSGFSQPDTSYVTMTQNASGANPLAEFGMDDGVTPAKLQAAKVAVAQWEKSDDPSLKAKAARFKAMEPDITAAAASSSDPETMAKAMDLLKPSAQIRQDVASQVAATKTVIEQGYNLAQMVKEQEGVLTATGFGASLFEAGKTELETLMNLVGDLGGQGATEEQVMQRVQQEAAKMGVPELAQQYTEFVGAQVRFIYAVGKTLGQQGNGFSNYDYARIKEAVAASGNADAFTGNMKRFIGERISDVDNQITSLGTLAEIQAVQQASPDLLAPLLAPVLTPFEQQVDPMYLEWLKEPTMVDGGQQQAAPMPPGLEKYFSPEEWGVLTPEEQQQAVQSINGA